MEFNAGETQAFEQKCTYCMLQQIGTGGRGGFLVLRSRAIFSLEITKLILVCNGINVLEGNNMPPAKTNLAAGTRSPFRVPLTKKKKKMKALNTLGREGREEEGCE